MGVSQCVCVCVCVFVCVCVPACLYLCVCVPKCVCVYACVCVCVCVSACVFLCVCVSKCVCVCVCVWGGAWLCVCVCGVLSFLLSFHPLTLQALVPKSLSPCVVSRIFGLLRCFLPWSLSSLLSAGIWLAGSDSGVSPNRCHTTHSIPSGHRCCVCVCVWVGGEGVCVKVCV